MHIYVHLKMKHNEINNSKMDLIIHSDCEMFALQSLSVLPCLTLRMNANM